VLYRASVHCCASFIHHPDVVFARPTSNAAALEPAGTTPMTGTWQSETLAADAAGTVLIA